MRTSIVFLMLLMFLQYSCDSPGEITTDPRGGEDYANVKVNLGTDNQRNGFEQIETGESLLLEFSGLKPGAELHAYLLDDQGQEWSYARVYADKRGNIPSFLFWYQTGVIGGTSREVKFKPKLAFETFAEAEEYFLAHPLRLELRDRQGKTFKEQAISFTKRKSAFIYPSNEEGVLWNAFNIMEEDLYVTGDRLPEGAEINLYLVPNQYQWAKEDELKDVRGGKEFLKSIKLKRGEQSFTAKILEKGAVLPGAYDIVARVNGNPLDLRLNRDDLVTFYEDTGVVLYIIINGNIVVETAGRMKGGPAKFEFSDAFEKGEDVCGAVEPTDVPAVHAGGSYAAYYVVEDQPASYWDGASPTLIDVSGGIEIQRVKYWCINASRRLIWPSATQADPIKGYDVIVDFGSVPAATSADFVADDEYDKGVDFVDGYNNVGFYVLEDPATPGSLPVGEVILDDPNGISGITDASGATGPTYPVDLAWAKIMYPGVSAGSGVAVNTSASNYPLVLFLHGNHLVCDADGSGPGLTSEVNASGWPIPAPCSSNANRVPNHEGYDYIMELLASQGFIAISISGHQVNMRGDSRNIETRGRLVLKYLDKLKDWNDNGTDPFGAIFNGKIDMSKIGLSGHSRGGEGVVAASEINASLATPYDILAVNSISPTDLAMAWGFASRFNVTNTVYFNLMGARDGDVWNLQGNRIYDRAYRTSAAAPIKDKINCLVYGANHNYFNTVWTNTAGLGSSNPWAGAGDNGSSIATSDVMTGANQRKVGQSMLCGFFRKYLKGAEGYKEIFTGRIKLSALPSNKLFMTYQDRQRKNVDNFENTPANAALNSLGGAVTTSGFTNNSEILMNQSGSDYSGTLPPSDVRFYQSTLGLKLTWGSNATYETQIPIAHKDVSAYKYLSFRVAKAPIGGGGTGGVNLNVNLEDGAANSALWDLRTDQFDAIPHPYDRSPQLLTLTTVRIPLQNFTMNNSNVDLTDIRKIIIKATGSNEIGLDDIEFTN